jgi:hypothetical protein
MRALWAAVVLQARDDLDGLAEGSTLYAQALSFFTATGAWQESRQAIADCLDVDIGVIERLGRVTIAARHAREGGAPALQVCQPALQICQPALPAKNLENLEAQPVATEPTAKRQAKAPRSRHWWIAQFLANEAAAIS